VVATDSVGNLTSRLRGSEAVSVEVSSDNGALDATQVRQRLEQVSGVSRVVAKESKDGRMKFEVESLQGRHVRPDLARTVVEAGWNLHELHPVAFSLEEIFLQLTASDAAAAGGGAQ
jgi:ABC-2 type transport system ATP-binding protein